MTKDTFSDGSVGRIIMFKECLRNNIMPFIVLDDDKVCESESITNQKSLLFQYVKENNLRVYNIYVDDGYSGTNFDRPDFNRIVT